MSERGECLAWLREERALLKPEAERWGRIAANAKAITDARWELVGHFTRTIEVFERKDADDD